MLDQSDVASTIFNMLNYQKRKEAFVTSVLKYQYDYMALKYYIDETVPIQTTLFWVDLISKIWKVKYQI